MTAALMVVLCAQAPAPKDLDRDAIKNIALLRSADRGERYRAALSLAKLRSLPESAVEPIVDYIKLQVEDAMVPPAMGRPRVDARVKKVPVTGEETSVSAIKANPGRYIGRTFVLVGGVKASDYYGHGFRDAVGEYYSFTLSELASDGESFLGSTSVYVPRFDGAALAEMVVKTEQQQGGAALAVRLRCSIRPARIEDGDLRYAADSIEATDWQVLRPGGEWGPWTFESIGLGYRLLFLTGKNSMLKCLDLIMDEGVYRDEKTDTALKGSAILYLLQLPAKDRTLVFRRVPARAKRARSAVARKWAQRVSESLSTGRLVL
jgi:hypothetical protein